MAGAVVLVTICGDYHYAMAGAFCAGDYHECMAGAGVLVTISFDYHYEWLEQACW